MRNSFDISSVVFVPSLQQKKEKKNEDEGIERERKGEEDYYS
jgi:hypothetical protein